MKAGSPRPAPVGIIIGISDATCLTWSDWSATNLISNLVEATPGTEPGISVLQMAGKQRAPPMGYTLRETAGSGGRSPRRRRPLGLSLAGPEGGHACAGCRERRHRAVGLWTQSGPVRPIVWRVTRRSLLN